MASRGYPASSSKGDVIGGLAEAAAEPDVTVYHAGTAFAAQAEAAGGAAPAGRPIVTAGGRVLAVSALGQDFAAARQRAYAAAAHIGFDGMQSRPDIAERAVKAERRELDLFPPTRAS
jgi:phosphoribosylamine--glycine ligase